MTTTYRPWLHRWALLTVIAVFPLLLSGGTVTSLRVGMADPVWPTPPWYLLAISWAEAATANGIGFLIEHGHRQIGWAVGLLTIVLTAWVWATDRRGWVRWLSLACLLGVIIQGVLGGMRVVLNERVGPELAMVHGVLGQIVFTLIAATALATSRSWIAGQVLESDKAARFQKMARLTMLMVLMQLVVGVWLRQMGQGPSAWVLFLHLFFALAVLSHAMMLVMRVRKGSLNVGGLFGPITKLLLALVLLQLALGAGAWWFGGGQGALDSALLDPHSLDFLHLAVLATKHVGCSALILMLATLITLRSLHHLRSLPATKATRQPIALTPLEAAV